MPIGAFMSKKLESNDYIAQLLAVDGLSLNQVAKSRVIQEFFEMKNLELPASVNSIRQSMLDMAAKKKAEIKTSIQQMISKCEFFSLTLDEWTARNNDRYMAIAILTGQSKICLGMVKIVGKANRDNLYNLICLKLKEFDIVLTDIVCLTTDGASLMKSLHNLMPCYGQLCLLHGIHLAVKDTMAIMNDCEDNDEDDDEDIVENSESEVDDFEFSCLIDPAMKKMKKLINRFRHSAILMENLDKYREANDKSKLSFLTIINIRWNSIFLAVERFIELYPELMKVVFDENLSRSIVHFIFFK